MSAPVTQAPVSAHALDVHQVIPGFVALTERGQWGACGMIAEAAALHVCDTWASVPFADRAATEATLTAWIAEYHAAGRASVTGITTLADIYWHLLAHQCHVAGYIPYSGAPNVDALHAFVKTHALAGNPVILQIVRAFNLPHNEQGIHSHFVVSGGIDSTQGYLLANGDTTEALTTNNFLLTAYWATWATLTNAGVCGAIALQRVIAPPATPPPSPTPTTPTPPSPVPPIGLSDAIAAVHTAQESLQTALDKIQALQTIGG